MSVPLIEINTQHKALADELRRAFDRHLTSGAFVLGEAVADFEKDLATYCQCPHALGLSSGTDALVIALMALGIGPGDEVICPSFTFFATAGSIARVGARPVFVDIDLDTFNLDPDHVEGSITPRTKAIMPVHLFGLLADMKRIMAIASKHGLRVIEDAAQAIGAAQDGQRACAWGDVGCLSFYPTKNLSALGDAGAVTAQDNALAAHLKSLRVHGQSDTYKHDHIGGNFRLDAMQASFLHIKLRHLDGYAIRRRENACRYHGALAGLSVVLPQAPDNMTHVYNQYTLRVPDGRRDALRKHLTGKSIGCGVYYPLPLHLQPCFEYVGLKRGALPRSEQAAGEVLSLPIYPELTQAQQDEVIQAIREFFH
ncbi:MAG: aminotransferase class I/II-fold pyridoxal phosphate-dependent enzyme [Phycisphaera sp.]|nr:aminotransferase class I/II-fold pyridoxal phosphate-dependent enzyme [Phycisphaera sp.]